MEPEEFQTARLAQRFWAAMIDGILEFMLVAAGYLVIHGSEFAERLTNSFETIGVPETDLRAPVVPMLFWLLLQGYPLHLRGQTIGKMAMKIRIADLRGGKPSFWRIIFLRYGVVGLVGVILETFAGALGLIALIDVIPIFGKQRRCLHDYLARTRVVVVTGSLRPLRT